MSETERLILQKLESIEQRLNQLFVPVVSEQARQLSQMPVEDRKKHQRDRMNKLRRATK